ncbi:MAG TPA: hypothetical protein VGL94_22310 [Ktedonobacteraceae bacterium]
MSQEEMLEQLPTENARLRQENMQLRDENQRLQGQVEQVSIQMHDLERTYEQGQPQQQQPSFSKKTRNLRKKRGKKPGGQIDHRLCMLAYQQKAGVPHVTQDRDDERSQ